MKTSLTHTRPRRSLRNVALTTAAAATLLIGIAGVAAPANAAAPANCPSGYSCFWGDSGYKTGSSSTLNMIYEHGIDNFRTWNYGNQIAVSLILGNTNDSASSVYNNGMRERSFWHVDMQKGGPTFFLPIGTGDDNLNNNTGAAPSGFNDKISSAYFETCDKNPNCTSF